MTDRLPFEQLWRPILTQFRRHRVARTVGLLVGVLPVVGFSLYYLNRGSSASAPIFDVIRALYWPGLPAEIVLNWTGWYEVPLWEAHMSPTETIMRWGVFSFVNIVLCLCLAVGAAAAIDSSRSLNRRI
jgi:hypothetical protein